MVRPSMENGISVLRTIGATPTEAPIRSSRYSVMSRAPTATSSPVMVRMSPAMRWAIGTPRLRTPTSAKSERPRLCSRISCEIRVSARLMRSASITTGICTSLRTLRSTFKETDRIISGFTCLPQDYPARRLRIERRIGAFPRLRQQRPHRRGVEIGGAGNTNASHATAAALEQALRIGQGAAFEKVEVDPAGIDRNRVDHVRGTFVCVKADHERV